MRTYEALYIVQPDVGDDEIQTIADGVASIVSDDGGTIVRSDIWGKRKLAYPVLKHTEGVYVLLRFEAEPTVLPKIEGHIRLTDPIIRHLIVHFDEQTLRLEAEQERRKERDRLEGRDRDRDRDRDRNDYRGRDRDDYRGRDRDDYRSRDRDDYRSRDRDDYRSRDRDEDRRERRA